MGLIGKVLFDAALKTAVKTSVTAKIADSVSPKLNAITKTMTNEEVLNDREFQFHLVVKNAPSRLVEWQYDIFDANRNLKYIVKRPTNNWRHEIHVYNHVDCLVGTIKEHKPFFKEVYEQEERTCDLKIDGNFIGQVRIHKSISPQNSLTFSYGDFRIRKNIYFTKIEVFQGERIICRINHQFAETKSIGKYVISYNNIEYEQVLLMFTIAMDKISFGRY